jgi:hypothetical protein
VTWSLAITLDVCVAFDPQHLPVGLSGRLGRDGPGSTPIYTASTEQAAKERLSKFAAAWSDKYPAVIQLWENVWSEFAPFLDYSPEIRQMIYSTNAVESLHARSAEPLVLAGISLTSRPQSNVPILSWAAWTPPAKAANA